MYERETERFFELHQPEMLESLRRLVKIPSVADAPAEGMPFGADCRRALSEAQSIAEDLGFSAQVREDCMLEVDINDKPPLLGILAHLDVVPACGKWSSDPFTLDLRDGYLYGRGVIDNKGPAVAALYAMKAASEIAPELSCGCRLLLGSAEEIGSLDLIKYMEKHTCPPRTFSPDADYPVINTEKGSYVPRITASWEDAAGSARVKELHASHTINSVSSQAHAVVEGIALKDASLACEKISKKTGVRLTAEVTEGAIHIFAEGKGSHASGVWRANNPLTALIEALCLLPLEESGGKRTLSALMTLVPHGDWRGEALGIAMSDELSGALTSAFTICDICETGMEARLNIRVPVCGTAENVKNVLDARFLAAGFDMPEDIKMRPHHHTSPDAPLVRTLLSVYEDYTGREGKCLSMGGGTYAHDVEGAVAFGCCFGGEPHSNLHNADENTSLSLLTLSARMFTEIILRECR